MRSGALAGAVATLAFTAIHHIFISNIWFSLIPMTIAGALCGLCLAWTYGRLFQAPSLSSWVRYNATYVGMFVLLGLVSVMIYEPRTTIAALVEANEPPNELIGAALPLTIAFTLAVAALITLFGRQLSNLFPVVVTCMVLVVTLGLNVSVLGLVDIPSGSAYLVLELFGLIVTLDLAFVAMFAALERKGLTGAG